jgi:hypothetical protein
LISRGYEFELVKKIAEPYFSNEPWLSTDRA